ncbi:MAG: PIN domain-containing protein [Candidatus Diapherotrites archaeon]|nr:PIN domain-containing protein [Candidatus Diapherotrites archaeon]
MYVDADLFYALLRAGDRHAELAQTVLASKEQQYTSVICLLELEIVVKRELSDEMSKTLLSAFKARFPKVKIKPLDERAFRKSLELRQKYGLGIFDAVHAAVALLNDGRIASTDKAFEKIPGLQVVV